MMKHLLLIFLFSSFFGLAQHQNKLDFIRGEVSIEPIASKKMIKGGVTYWFKVKQDVDSLFLDAKNMYFEESYLNDKSIVLNNTGRTISIKKAFKKGEEYKLELYYTASPKQTVYFLGWDDNIDNNEQIWTQGQGKYTSHWLPSFDAMEEKIEFSLLIKTPKDVRAIANGTMVIDPYVEDDSITWHFNMQKPMSSYLLAFAIGNYNKQELISKSGIPIENYYYPEDSLKVEPTYRYTKEIFDFLEDEIGVPYPWQNYKQIPVRDFLYAGMENTTATIFSDGYVIDSTAFIDKNYVNVNAHELAHQWFGNLVTEKDGNHHWLHEGFATYYAYLAEKHLFGDDHFYWKLFNTAKKLQKLSEDGKGQALTDSKATSATFYEKGAWALVMLKDKIGDRAFKKGIKTYLKKYQFQNVTIDNFIEEMEAAAKVSLADFEAKWLKSADFSSEDVKMYLRSKNTSINKFYSLDSKVIIFEAMLVEDEPTAYKMAFLEKSEKDLKDSYWIIALQSPDRKIRQKAIQMLGEVSENENVNAMKPLLEKLLLDESYVTIENTLFKLWITYPQEKAKYLEQTKDVIGLPNKNVRLLWLTLAILTNDYNGRNTQNYFKELSDYTSKKYGWEVRMGAFQYLNQAIGLNDDSLKSLVSACTHHSWQFKKFARNLMNDLLKDEEYKQRLIAIKKELKDEELRYMNTKLQE